MTSDGGRQAVLAQTRFSPPRLDAGTIDRPRLLQRILGAEAGLTVVNGPPGSGKSTLLAQCHGAVPDGAWLSLDRGDNDPARLWRGITNAVAEVRPDFGSTYRKLLSSQTPQVIDVVVPAAINELADLGRPLCLFIDDLHVLTSAESLRSLELFLDQRPDGVAVVIGGRHAPPFALRRYRLGPGLVEIGPADLAMGTDEAAAMLNAAGLDLDRTAIEHLEERLEGWTGGLRWASMALTNNPDVDRFLSLASLPDGDIARYLVEEVLDQLPADRRQFMLETSILAFLDGDVCDAVRERSDSGLILEQLERSNAFVTRGARVGGRYRYHDLAREILVARLVREMPAKVADLHRRAAVWCFDHGEVREAIDHALRAGDRIEAADMLCAKWFEMLNSGQIQTVITMLERFELSETHGYQPLAAAASLAYGLDGDDPKSRAFYASALSGSYDGTPPDGSASMESCTAILRAALMFEGVQQALLDSELSYRLEPAGSPWRPLLGLIVGLCHSWSGDFSAATPYLEEITISRESDRAVVVYALAELAVGQLEGGKPEEARATAEEACALAREAGVEMLLPACIAHAAAALAHLVLGHQQGATVHLENAVAPVRALENAMPLDAVRAKTLLADASLQLGFLDAAEAYINQAAESAARVGDTGELGGRLSELQRRVARAKADSSPDYALTDRELEVLNLLATDLTNRQIAASLYLSRNTVKTYQRRIYRKLGVNTRADAVVVGRRSKLIPEDTTTF